MNVNFEPIIRRLILVLVSLYPKIFVSPQTRLKANPTLIMYLKKRLIKTTRWLLRSLLFQDCFQLITQPGPCCSPGCVHFSKTTNNRQIINQSTNKPANNGQLTNLNIRITFNQSITIVEQVSVGMYVFNCVFVLDSRRFNAFFLFALLARYLSVCYCI